MSNYEITPVHQSFLIIDKDYVVTITMNDWDFLTYQNVAFPLLNGKKNVMEVHFFGL